MKNQDIELTPEQIAELEALAAMSDDDIDTSDIPEIVDWSNARRGVFQLPTDQRRTALLELKRAHPAVADTSERGLESYIVAILTGVYGSPPPDNQLGDRTAAYGAGWLPGEPSDYDRDFCVDLAQMETFLRVTQPDSAESLALDTDNIARQRFLTRLKRQVTDRGVVDVLRNGVRHGQHNISLFYGSPTPGNERAQRPEPVLHNPPAALQRCKCRPGP